MATGPTPAAVANSAPTDWENVDPGDWQNVKPFTQPPDIKAHAPLPQPGIMSRFGEGMGFPTTTEGWTQAGQQMAQPISIPGHPIASAIASDVAGPAGNAAKAVYGYGKNLIDKGQQMVDAIHNAPTGNGGAAVEAGTKFLTGGVLAPVGGTSLYNLSDDLTARNWRASAGDIMSLAGNLLTLGAASGPSAEAQINKLSYAIGPKATKALTNTLDYINKVKADTGAEVNSVQDFKDLINRAKTDINTEYGNAIGPHANKPINTQPIADNIRDLITSDMDFTAEGRAQKKAINDAALEYESSPAHQPSLTTPIAPSAGPNAVSDGISKLLQRRLRDDAGQGALDEMSANGEKVGDVSNKFWTNTYWKLPGPVQQTFNKYVKRLWGGEEPGGVVAIDKDKNPIHSKDWQDMADKLNLSDDPEHLEGTERGYVVLMREANNRLADIQRMGQQGIVRSHPLLSQGEKILNPNAAQTPSSGWTLGALDSKRSRLAADLASHNAKESVGRYTAERGNTNLAIDNAILDSLRDTVYPQADLLADKPSGYFENLKQNQSGMMQLESILNKRIDDLTGQTAVAKGAPLSSRLHGGVSVSPSGAHGYLSRFMNVISPEDVLQNANTATSRAMKKGSPVAKGLVLSYPIRALSTGPAANWWENQP